MNVHIEGMGVLGSILAWHLYERDIQFTWHDTHEKVKAWKASTGCVYPCGDPKEMEAYQQWRDWHEKGAPWGKHLKGITEQAAYWFITKKPPHDGDYPILETISPMQKGSLCTVQVNAQELVKGTREFFTDRKSGPHPEGRIYPVKIIAHGFNERLTHYKWGWSAMAEVHFSRKLIHASAPLRVCADLKRGMVSPLIYAYPMPGHKNLHYIGSSIIRQTKPKKLDVKSKIEFWRTEVEELTEGFVSLIDVVGDYREGWRPCGEENDTKLVKRIGDALVIKPMQHSGVRMAPLVINKLLEKLNAI